MKNYINLAAIILVMGMAGCDETHTKGGGGVTQSQVEALETGQAAIRKELEEMQTKDGGRAIESEIQALKTSQAAIRKDLEEIRKLLESKKKPPPVRDINLVLDVSADPYKGSKAARLTMVEYTDYECPFCARHAKSVLPQFMKNYVETGKVRYILRDFPLSFHKNAVKAAYAAHCAGDQGKYWEMHDKLFENQRALGEDKLPGYAEAVGLDVVKFNDCLANDSYKARVDANMRDGRKAGISGTPSFVLGFTQDGGNKVKGEKLIRGALGYNVFQKAVDEMLAKKK